MLTSRRTTLAIGEAIGSGRRILGRLTPAATTLRSWPRLAATASTLTPRTGPAVASSLGGPGQRWYARCAAAAACVFRGDLRAVRVALRSPWPPPSRYPPTTIRNEVLISAAVGVFTPSRGTATSLSDSGTETADSIPVGIAHERRRRRQFRLCASSVPQPLGIRRQSCPYAVTAVCSCMFSCPSFVWAGRARRGLRRPGPGGHGGGLAGAAGGRRPGADGQPHDATRRSVERPTPLSSSPAPSPLQCIGALLTGTLTTQRSGNITPRWNKKWEVSGALEARRRHLSSHLWSDAPARVWPWRAGQRRAVAA